MSGSPAPSPTRIGPKDRRGVACPGALVFCQGVALGVIIEHHPRQGRSAITILPVERFAAVPAGGDPDARRWLGCSGFPPRTGCRWPGDGRWPGLSTYWLTARLPRVAELDPYTLGATPSGYGNADTYGQRDEYVPRTKDEPLAAALRPGRLVVLVGPSKAGKTRTAFEVLRAHDDWSGALLAAPVPQSLDQLAGHPALEQFRPAGDLARRTASVSCRPPGNCPRPRSPACSIGRDRPCCSPPSVPSNGTYCGAPRAS